MITVIDFGMGNLGSIQNMFKRIGAPSSIESDISKVAKASKLLLPGVGSFDAAMTRIDGIHGLRDVLNERVLGYHVPILGVCLGMQLMTRGSEEGNLKGLGWVEADTLKIPQSENLKIPHMGWNKSIIGDYSNPLLKGIDDDARFYFVHSYCVKVDKPKHSIMRTKYSVEFDSAFNVDNIYAVQFHPEKSHRFGLQILKNFSELKHDT